LGWRFYDASGGLMRVRSGVGCGFRFGFSFFLGALLGDASGDADCDLSLLRSSKISLAEVSR
jgi:hypothetical protein